MDRFVFRKIAWVKVKNGGERSKTGKEGFITKLLEPFRLQVVLSWSKGRGVGDGRKCKVSISSLGLHKKAP